MSVASRDPCRPPLATIATLGNAGHVTSPTPNSSAARGVSPPAQPYRQHTPPSRSNAQLLAGMSPTTMSFLAGLSTGLAPGTPTVAGIDTTLEPPTESSTGDGVHQSPLGAASSAAIATSDDILRGIYNEKLQASVRSIIMTLSTELPQDHIFLQLLADPTTLQYCKVRLAEVVEGFLYSTQAEQYHTLATELARGERNCAQMHQRIEELEAALAVASTLARSSTPQHQGLSSHGGASSTGEGYAHQAAPAGLWRTSSPTMTPALAAEAPTTSSVSPILPTNPMEHEEARRELLRVLEQATHDQELLRCSQALQAVSKVVDVAQDEPRCQDKYVFEEELLVELYKCIHSLLHYVDGALESQERLRSEIQEQQQHWLNGASAEGNTQNVNDDVMGRSVGSVSRSASASTATKGSGTPRVLDSGYCTPRHPQVSLGNVGTALLNRAVDSRFSSASSPAAADHTRAIHQQRKRLQHLAAQLREGQTHASQVLQSLAQVESARRREVAQLEMAVAAAREEVVVATSAAESARQVKENSERLHAEHAAFVARERTELCDQLADVHAQLAAATQDLHAARRELRSATTRAEAAEEKAKDLSAELAAVKAAMSRRDVEWHEQKSDGVARQAELTALKAAHQSTVDALQDAERELLCLRVEGTMAGLSALYQEAKAVKAELLERDGYRPLSQICSSTVATQQEVVRRAQMQSQLAESAQVEQAVAQRGCMDTLGVLLRTMWADEAIESALAPSSANTAAPVVTLTTLTDAKDTSDALRDGRTRRSSRTGSCGSIASGDAEDLGAENLRGSHCYHLPTTLSEFCSSLEYAYNNVRARHRARQKTINSLRAELVSKDIELRAAQASEAQLQDLLKAGQAKEEQWKSEMAQLSDRSPMRGLLARQETLLKAVSDERNELRRLWDQLSGDYIALEQRNGALHARCAEKEHENARLNGMLRRSGTPTTPAGSRRRDGPSYGAARGPSAIPTAAEAAPKPPALATAAVQLGTSVTHPVSALPLGPSPSSHFSPPPPKASSNQVLK
ncbi:hypothetical protein, conserved [Leishmania tarentolae]|uniref:Uncharacterized protein n=1 Tax=Leishmania tarentolae TaxID=5689 RepID=A0A640KAG4_LEITA|nr:hypothetical protein, conserved [Leishmania tarentolae]